MANEPQWLKDLENMNGHDGRLIALIPDEYLSGTVAWQVIDVLVAGDDDREYAESIIGEGKTPEEAIERAKKRLSIVQSDSA